jgi:predicted ATPase/DNA-binding SARP family transcriptional activator
MVDDGAGRSPAGRWQPGQQRFAASAPAGLPPRSCQTGDVLRVLGSVDAGDGTTLRSRAQRVITSALVLEAGAVVSADRLAELVWGDDQPTDPSGALQSHVSRLRRLLPPAVEVVAEGAGYRLRAPAEATDVGRFEAGCRDAAGAQDGDERFTAAESALALWRGAPYPDLDDTRAAGERARLTEARSSLIELEAESLIRSGRPAEAIARLEAMRVDEPLRERTVEWLMRAYVGAGRKTDALDAFSALRSELVEQMGLDPSPELRELERAIITEEFVGFPAAAAPAEAPSQPSIMVPASAFVGRAREVESLVEMLGESRVVSLVGPGGVGKTRLALHAAASAAHSAGIVDVVELAALRSGHELPESVATALAVQPQANVTATQRVVDAAGSRPRLIVLDNCEHVIDDAAAFVDDVVRATPQVVFLATSREPLNIDAEVVVRVEPLAPDGPAVDLFVDRAAGMGSGTAIDEISRSLVAQVCRSLDGLPLAIELAAAQLGGMTLEELAADVARPLEILQRGRRTADDRHRSIRGLVEWSVQDLDPTLLTVFTATAAFAGPFTASAVAWLTELPRPVITAALADLVDRSLVVVDSRAGPVARFTTLETIRAYAAERLAASDQLERISARHGDWALSLVEGIASDLERWADAESSGVVSVHLPDLRVAHQRFHATDDADRALRLAAALHYVAYYGMHGELFGWITETAERFGTSGHPDAETVLASSSIGAWQSGDLSAAADYSSRAARAVHPTAPGAGRGAAEASADVARFSDDHEAARDGYTRAVDRAREEGNTPRVVTNLADLATAAGYLGDLDGVRAAVAEARDLLGADDPVAGRAWIEYSEGEALADHDPAVAMSLLSGAVDLAEQSRAAFIIGVTRLTFTNLQLRAGDPADAMPGLVALIEHWRARGARLQQWITLRSVVELFLHLDAPREAAAVLGAVIGSATAAAPGGADAERLAAARETVLTDVPDADQLLATWAERDQDAVVDHVLKQLRAMSRARHDLAGWR